MKKLLLIILSVLFVCVMTACRTHDHTQSTTPGAPQDTAESTSSSAATTDASTPIQPTVVSTAPTTLPTDGPDAWTHEAALTRFLTETNQNGKVSYPPDTPPGTPPPIENIPQSNQALVGHTVMIILAQEQQAIPFYYSFDADAAKERLAVVVSADRIPMMIIFETNLGGSAELCKKIASNEAFEAVIVSMTNISFEEGMTICTASSITSVEQQIDIFTPSTQDICGEYIGTVGTHSSGRIIHFLAGAESSQISDALRSYMDVWYRVFQRFNLLDIVGKQ